MLGLVAIFVSLNSQHNVEKARQTIWDLKKIPFEILNLKKEDFARKKEQVLYSLWIYNEVTNNRKDFTKTIVNISIIIIIAVCIIWGTLLLFVDFTKKPEVLYITIVTSIIIILMSTFIWVLKKLNNIPLISRLPKYEELLDISKAHLTNVDTLALIAILMKIRIAKVFYDNKDPEYKLEVGLPVLFENFKIGWASDGSGVNVIKLEEQVITKDMIKSFGGDIAWFEIGGSKSYPLRDQHIEVQVERGNNGYILTYDVAEHDLLHMPWEGEQHTFDGIPVEERIIDNPIHVLRKTGIIDTLQKFSQDYEKQTDAFVNFCRSDIVDNYPFALIKHRSWITFLGEKCGYTDEKHLPIYKILKIQDPKKGIKARLAGLLKKNQHDLEVGQELAITRDGEHAYYAIIVMDQQYNHVRKFVNEAFVLQLYITRTKNYLKRNFWQCYKDFYTDLVAYFVSILVFNKKGK